MRGRRSIGHPNPVLLRPGGRGDKVRNVETGRTLPCCWDDCTADGSTKYELRIPHPQPRWRDPVKGTQEMLVYIFCGDEHRRHFAAGTVYADKV